MTHVTRSRFAVRSYEVDSYAHLNNGVYVSWFEHARLEWLLSLGYSYDGFAERQQWFVVARIEVDFRAPLLSGEQVVVSTRVTDLGRSSVRFAQSMQRCERQDAEPGQMVCEARTVMVFSGVGGGSIPIPPDVRTRFEGAPG